jgi:hypothetical protein
MQKTTNRANKEEFDSVKMMRDIRDELSNRWMHHPGVMKKDLEKTRKEYNQLFKK